MSGYELVYPMFALVVLTFIVLVSLFRTRAASVRQGNVKASYYRTYVGETEPDESIQLSRHFSNLFEAPTLFYVVCVTVMAAGLTDMIFIGLAWSYVSLRVAHAYIHTGSNILQWRIAAYFSSWSVLIAIWAYLSLRVAGAV